MLNIPHRRLPPQAAYASFRDKLIAANQAFSNIFATLVWHQCCVTVAAIVLAAVLTARKYYKQFVPLHFEGELRG